MAKLLSAFFFIAVIGVASAANFGTATKGSRSLLQNGETEFTLLFWNSGGEPIRIFLEPLDVPEGFFVEMEKYEIIINNASGNEAVYTQEGYVMATGVKVFVHASNASLGVHRIKISAKSVADGTNLLFSQERVFNLDVEVGGEVTSLQSPQENLQSPQEKYVTENHNNRTTGGMNYQYFAAIIIIIFISLIIYRHS